jgi:hypothetical protein
MFVHNDPAAKPTKRKNKDSKRKIEVVLAAEPEQKHHRTEDDASKDECPYCIYPKKHTEDCYELKKLRNKHGSQRRRGNGRGGGHGSGRFGVHGNNYQQNPHEDNAAQQHLDEGNDNFIDEEAGGYQEPRRLMACILGGAQAPISSRHFKQLSREIAAACPEADPQKLKWAQYAITIDTGDHPKSTKTMGTIPLVCTSTINNVAVTKTLIDGGAGLNVISIETFEKMQVPHKRLMLTRPFSGVTEGTTIPLGQVHLPVTFGTRDNYCSELIDFDVAHVGLPYNAILGYPALAKFMAVTHHACNTVKLSGYSGTINVHGD